MSKGVNEITDLSPPSTDGQDCRGFTVRMSAVTGSENTKHGTELGYKYEGPWNLSQRDSSQKS